MKRRLLLIFLVGSSSLLAGDVDLFGYFESQIMGAQINEDFIQMQSNKLRLDLEHRINRIEFRANVNWITYHGKTEWFIPDFLPEPIADQIPAALRPCFVLPFEDTSVLDNAFARISFRRWDLTAGKQQISLGTGYAWNPTDLFNNKDLFDPTYEQPGHAAIRADIPLASRINLTCLYGPEDIWKNSSKAIDLKIGLGRFDCSLTVIEKQWTLHDYTHLFLTGPIEISETRRMFGGSLSGELLGLGVWTEGGFNAMENSDDFTEVIAGTDYTFDSGTYVMGEVYYNSGCPEKATDYSLTDWMRYFSAEQKSINRYQVYLLLQHPVSDQTQAGMSIVAAGDGSVVLLPTLTTTPYENLEVLAYLNLYIGEELKAFNPNQGNGGILRARIYF